MKSTVWRNASLATMQAGSPWGWIEAGAMVVQGDKLQWVGPVDDLPTGLDIEDDIDLQRALVTPGLIDCHTHLVYGGDRAAEFEQRLQGASYEDISRAG